MLLKAVFVLLAIFATIKLCKASEERKQKMCGPVLYQALENICKNGFSTKERKSVPSTSQDDYDMKDWPYGDGTNYIHRRNFDLITECCRNACSYETLKLYCLE